VPAVKIPISGNLLGYTTPTDARRRLHPCFAKIAFDRRSAVEHGADGDRRRSGFGRLGLLDNVVAVLAGVKLRAESVERRGKSLRICLEK